MILIEILVTVLIADFVSGLFHWLEDAYGHADWPIVGWLITAPNILHHHDPRYFTRHGWFHSSWLLLCIAVLIVAGAWLCGVLTWHVWLFAALGANANQIHKWAHRSPAENGVIVSFLQRIRLLQTPRHHAQHHIDPKNSHYCVLTKFLNPLLDALGLWERLEVLVWAICGLRRRVDLSVEVAGQVGSRLAQILDRGSATRSVSERRIALRNLAKVPSFEAAAGRRPAVRSLGVLSASSGRGIKRLADLGRRACFRGRRWSSSGRCSWCGCGNGCG